MPSKYPICTSSEIIKTLRQFGFIEVSQKGSHIKLSNGKRVCIVPNHKEVLKGTLKSILTQAGVSLDEFLEKL